MTLEPFKPGLSPANKRPEHRSYSLLYVEDEDTNWEVAEVTLRDRYTLSRAKTAREALQLLSQNSYDAILMDIQLSGSELNGIQLTQLLRGKFAGTIPLSAQSLGNKNTPVIFVTAYNARYSKEELMAAGGDDMIPKPVDFTRLALAIAKLVIRRMGEKK